MNIIRKAIESQYKGICTVYEYQSVKDEETLVTSTEPVIVLENQPCKLSYENINTVSDGIPTQTMGVKLFIAPEIEIKSGSKIVVTQNGVTTEYAQSGFPAKYTNHQEIKLQLYEKFA